MRSWAVGAAIVVVGWTLAPASLLAQEEAVESQVREGSTVRVRVLEDPSIISQLYPHDVYEGTVTAYTANSLVLTPTKPLGLDEMEIPWTDMERLDLGLPKEGNFWRGALIGAAAVGAGSALLGLVTCNEEACAFGDMTTGQAVLLMGGIGAAIGFVAGGLVGAQSGGMQWEEVSIEGLRIQADADGAGLAIFVPLRL